MEHSGPKTGSNSMVQLTSVPKDNFSRRLYCKAYATQIAARTEHLRLQVPMFIDSLIFGRILLSY